MMMVNFASTTHHLLVSSAIGKTWTGRLNFETPECVTWLVDGNNLQCSRFVPRDRGAIIEELKKVASPDDYADEKAISNVVLVFDGNEDEPFQKTVESKWFQYVVADGKGKKKDRADDYMVDHAMPELQALGGRVHLVSADKELGKRIQATGIMNGGSLVHPPKFWKQYLPNLQAKNAN